MNMLNKYSFICIWCFTLFSLSAFSQKNIPFQSGEVLKYNINYKYGIVMVNAGSAEHKIKEEKLNNANAVKASISFKTNNFFDKIFKIRDTLYTYSTPDLRPIYHKKYLHEGKTHYIEDFKYHEFSSQFTSGKSKRISEGEIKFDSLLVTNGFGYDMLQIFTFARTLDYNSLKTGDTFSLAAFVGTDIVPLIARYMGQRIIDKGNTKFKTLLFEIDIVDKAFDTKQNSMEIWIGDDENRIPIKLSAKLKIGTAEAELSSYKNLKHPFHSKIVIKK